MGDIRKATMADNERLAETFTSAFADDPMFGWMFPDDRTRLKKLKAFFLFAGPRMGLNHDEVWMMDDGSAAAVWIPPDEWRTPMPRQLAMVPGMLRVCGRDTGRVLGTLGLMEKQHPHDPPSWYLLALGTEKEKQGKGHGSTLISRMLEQCDEQGLPAYLESSNPRNIPFYARHGFEEREAIRPGKGGTGPVLTPMWREPRG
jgi:GNAT superfamily N-acetyltransferase